MGTLIKFLGALSLAVFAGVLANFLSALFAIAEAGASLSDISGFATGDLGSDGTESDTDRAETMSGFVLIMGQTLFLLALPLLTAMAKQDHARTANQISSLTLTIFILGIMAIPIIYVSVDVIIPIFPDTISQDSLSWFFALLGFLILNANARRSANHQSYRNQRAAVYAGKEGPPSMW